MLQLSTGNWTEAPSDSQSSVRVLNLPKEATESWVRMLFCPIGRVVSVDIVEEAETSTAMVRLATAQQAEASYRFNGYMASGRRLQILPVTSASAPPELRSAHTPGNASPDVFQADHRPRSVGPMPRGRRTDSSPTHKNLYVLNLPLDVTTDQLAALFGRYGTVIHCVILAMLDAQARRRGFIDMSQASEAKEVIESLNGFVWHGYPIEVSYAIVQRSGGPFDPTGGTRNLIKRNVPRNRFNTGPRRVPSDSSLPSIPLTGTGADMPGARPTSVPSPCPSSPGFSDGSGSSADVSADPRTIFITNTNFLPVNNDDELKAMAERFGAVTRATLSRDEYGGSKGVGIVSFLSEAEADQAIAALDGTPSGGHYITAQKLVVPVAGISNQPRTTLGMLDSRPFPFAHNHTDGAQPNHSSMPRDWYSSLGSTTPHFSALMPHHFNTPIFHPMHAASPTPAQCFPSGPFYYSDFRHPAHQVVDDATPSSRFRAGEEWSPKVSHYGSPDTFTSASVARPHALNDHAAQPASAIFREKYLSGSQRLFEPKLGPLGTFANKPNLGDRWQADFPATTSLPFGSMDSVPGFWTPTREMKRPNQTPESIRSISSFTSAGSPLHTPLNDLTGAGNLWRIHSSHDYGFSPLQARSAQTSRGDELREGSLPIVNKAGAKSLSHAPGMAEHFSKQVPLAPVGHEKTSSPPRKERKDDFSDEFPDLGSLNLSS